MHTSPPWDVPQASPSAINQAFRSRDAPLNLKLRLVLFPVRSLIPYRSQFAHFSFTFDPNTSFVPITLILDLNSTQLDENASICLPIVQSSLQILWNLLQFFLHASNLSPIQHHLSQFRSNVAQFTSTHCNSIRRASIRLKLSTFVPKTSPATNKCVDLIAGRYIYSIHAEHSFQSSSTQPNSPQLI